MWKSRLILTSAMRFEYQLRFLFFNYPVTGQRAMRRYEAVKISTDDAKRVLLDTIGLTYRGERYFDVVDRVYTRLQTGFMPVYDVRLSLPEGLSFHQLLNMYDGIRIAGIRRGWYVPLFI
jgi:hypothetical protein